MNRLSGWLRNLHRVYVAQWFALFIMIPIGLSMVAVPWRGASGYLFAIAPIVPIMLGALLLANGLYLLLFTPSLPRYAQVLFMTPYLLWAFLAVPLAYDLVVSPALIPLRLYVYLMTVLAMVRRPNDA